MDSCDSSRRFVRPLLDWAAAPPDAREARRALMNPANEFWPWLYGVIERCYRLSLDHFWGVTKAEFRDGCVQKIFAWAKENTAVLQRPDFTDAKLGAFVKTTACHERISIWRRMRKLNSLNPYLDDSSGSPDQFEPMRRTTPSRLRVEPVDPFAPRYERLRAEFLHARRLMPLFHQSLRGKKRMRQVLALLLRLGRRLGKTKGFPGYWYVYRILRQRGKHLPEYLRGFLKKRLSDLEYNVINSRLGYLRRAFTNFSL